MFNSIDLGLLRRQAGRAADRAAGARSYPPELTYLSHARPIYSSDRISIQATAAPNTEPPAIHHHTCSPGSRNASHHETAPATAPEASPARLRRRWLPRMCGAKTSRPAVSTPNGTAIPTKSFQLGLLRSISTVPRSVPATRPMPARCHQAKAGSLIRIRSTGALDDVRAPRGPGSRPFQAAYVSRQPITRAEAHACHNDGA